MPVSDVLKKFRGDDYKDKDSDDAPEKDENIRTIMLTDEEAKSLQPYQVHPGEEIILEVSGKLEDDGHFHVMSVKYANPEGVANADAEQVAGGAVGGPPMMNMQTQPSPS